jgi:hypothetical protein
MALQQPGHIRDEAKPTPKRLVCDPRQPVRRGAAGFRDLGMCGGVWADLMSRRAQTGPEHS